MFWIPGIGASMSLLMVNAVHRDDLAASSVFDEGSATARRAWLFVSYIASFAAVGGALASLIVHFSKHSHDMWTGAVSGALTPRERGSPS